MYNYASFTKPTDNTQTKDYISNSNMTFAFGREMDLYKSKSESNVQLLNDRDMFNKFSNTNDSIDTSSFNLKDSYGMPIQGGNTTNNKKNLLSTPYIMESNEKNNWVSSSTTWDQNDMFAELEIDNKNNISSSNSASNSASNSNSNLQQKQDNQLEMAYNNNLSGSTTEDNDLCKIEADCLGFEYELTKQKQIQTQKDIIVDISSPFALAYIWKTLILLSKNPSTDKFVKMLGIKNKDSIVSDMKRHAEVFEDSGKLQILIPVNSTGQTANTNYIKKIEEIYKISILPNQETQDNVATINLDWNFLLEIPFYYQPKIITDYLIGYSKSKTKFLELTDVPVYLSIDRNKNIVCLEIPFASNMILGFVYAPNRELVDKIPYELITQQNKPEVIVKKLIIPKLNRNKKSVYSKNFSDILSQVHLGEIVYGTLYQVNIQMSMGLSIGVSKEISNNKYQIAKSFDNITINHKCFYYIKNTNIPNKILSTGMILY